MARIWRGNLICLMFVVCMLVTILACSEGEPQANFKLVGYTQEKHVLADGTVEWDDEVSVTYKVTNIGDVEIEEFKMLIAVLVIDPNPPHTDEEFSKEVSGGPIKPGRHVTQTFVVHIPPLPVFHARLYWYWLGGERIWLD